MVITLVNRKIDTAPSDLSAGGASFKPRFAPESGGHVPLEGGVKRHLHSDVGQQGNKLTENPMRKSFVSCLGQGDNNTSFTTDGVQ